MRTLKLQVKQRDRRALIILALALLTYELATAILIPAYDRLAAARDVAAEKETQLKRYRRAQLRKGQYADLIKTASARVAQSESTVISAATLPLASAELQAMIEDASNKLGLVVGQRMIGTPKRLNDFYAELPLTLSFDSTPGQLIAFLNEIRTLPRFLTVRTLQVSPVQPVLDAPKGQELTKNLRVSMTIYGLASAAIAKSESGKK